MAQVKNDRYAFLVEWVDPVARITWKYELLYYVKDGSIEMVDLKNKRMFLKRVAYPQLKLEHLFVGAVVTVYARQLKVVDFSDDFTRKQLGSARERTFAMVKPGAFKHLGKIINAIQKSGFIIANAKMVQFSARENKPNPDRDARQFYAVHEGKPFFERLVAYITSGPVVGFELVADGAIAKWRQLIGPTDSFRARAEAPESLRAKFGTDGTDNACHGSDAPDTAAQELSLFFSRGMRASCRADGSTALLVVKPHALLSGSAGLIVDQVQQSGNLDIVGLGLFAVDRTNSSEFLEVYRGVVAEYPQMVEELTSGPLLAVEVAARSPSDSVPLLRELCGPVDPEVGRVLRPRTLRAQFGADKVHNAVHCTDLPEDGQLETNYFFRILAAQ